MARLYKRVWDKDFSKQKERTARGHYKGESWQVSWRGADGKKSESGFRTKDEAAAFGQQQEETPAAHP